MTGGSAMQLLVGMRACSKCDGQACRGEQREQKSSHSSMNGGLRSQELGHKEMLAFYMKGIVWYRKIHSSPCIPCDMFRDRLLWFLCRVCGLGFRWWES